MHLSALIDPIPQKIVFVCDTFADEIVAPLQQKYAEKIEFTDTLPPYKDLKNTLIVILIKSYLVLGRLSRA